MSLPRMLAALLLIALLPCAYTQDDSAATSTTATTFITSHVTETTHTSLGPTPTSLTTSTSSSSSSTTSSLTSSSSSATYANIYAPSLAPCPATPLVRDAGSIAPIEAAFAVQRKSIATTALVSFLSRTGAVFPKLKSTNYPTVALASSGGGSTAFLSGAGFVKGIDSRENVNCSTSGLFQALTYWSGLSGGNSMLSAVTANDFATVSSLQSALWAPGFNTAIIANTPANLALLPMVKYWLATKAAAGFPVSIADALGIEIMTGNVYSTEAAASKTYSEIANSPSLKNRQMPLPIIMSNGVDPETQCSPDRKAPNYETTPFEFGSWDTGVAAFTPTKYLGTSMSGGRLSNSSGSCVVGFDRHSLVLGTSANIYAAVLCPGGIFENLESSLALPTSVQQGLLPDSAPKTLQQYALYPNPFYNYSRANSTTTSRVASQDLLTLVDGGSSGMGTPLWPYLFRPDVNLVIANDNGPKGGLHLPTGADLYNFYTSAVAANMSARVPVIPAPKIFQQKGLLTRPTFFGCNSADGKKMTIAYFPNRKISFDVAQAFPRNAYTAAEVDAEIANGVQVANNAGAARFGACMGCLALKKGATREKKALPMVCSSCFKQYCYN